MDYGLFIPIVNNGWIQSTTSPQYKPTFDLNRQIVQKAERYGFKFALSMIKFRGFGGPSEYWDYALDSFTLMAGLAAVTERIQLYASVATLSLHPAVAARMAVTIDSIAPGRFGINVVAGWNKSEYAQMGLWPGDDLYEYRYDYASEYVYIMKELWSKGKCDFQGRHFTMDDCVCKPLPVGPIKIVSAGMSPRGRQFAAEYCDHNFTSPTTDKEGLGQVNQLVAEAGRKTGRGISSYPLYMIILGETDERAQAKVDLYNRGVDLESFAAMAGQASLDKNSEGTSAVLVQRDPIAVSSDRAIVGAPATVAARLRELQSVEGTGGIMLMFDDFLEGTETFGRDVMPLLG